MNRFIEHVLPYLPGCPRELARRETLQAAREFCTKSHIWRVPFTETVTEQTGEVFISPGVSGAIVIDALEVKVNGRGNTRRFFSGGKIMFESPLNAGDEVTCTAILSPSVTATKLPTLLFTSWLEGIAAGARARLARMPGKDWYNPAMAREEQHTFLHQIGQAGMAARSQGYDDMTRIRLRSWV